MTVVIRLVGLALGGPTGLEGTYLQSYTADGHGGRGHVVGTRDISEAKRYQTAIEAMEEWRRVSRSHPIRGDGKPNRPLSAYTIEVVRTP
jgi:hypothetical protein